MNRDQSKPKRRREPAVGVSTKFDPVDNAYWQAIHDRERRKRERWGPPPQPRHLRKRARKRGNALPVVFRAFAAFVRFLGRPVEPKLVAACVDALSRARR